MLIQRHKHPRKVSLKRFWAYEDPPEVDPEVGVSAEVSTAAITPAVEADPAGVTINWNDIIPEPLREKEHFKNILKAENPGLEMATQFDNAQTLIGKRTPGLPAADAPEEEWTKFYEAARPEKAEDYDIKAPVFTGDDAAFGEYVKGIQDEARVTAIKTAMHEEGLTARQAARLAEKVQAIDEPAYRKAFQANVDLDNHFIEMAKKSFGGDAEKAKAYGKSFIEEFTTEKTKAYAQGLSNEALMLIAEMGTMFHAKYKKEDTFEPGGGGSDGGTEATVQAELHRIMALPAFTDPMAGDEHTRLRAQATELSAKLTQLRKKQ
jgi:hypothetical protein